MSTPSTGRRAARRQRQRRGRGGAAAGVGMLALAAGLLVTAEAVEAEPEPPGRSTTVPVDQGTAACATFPELDAGRVFTLAAPVPGAADGGSLKVGAVGARAEKVETDRGELRQLDVDRPTSDTGSAVGLAAAGEAAVGRATFQVDEADTAAGVALQECLAPRSRWWFTGGGAGLDHKSALVLANVDPGPAVVDVRALGGARDDDVEGIRGVTLQPGEVRILDLLDVAPQAEELAVHVEASRGRVVAALADSLAPAPASAPGVEWVPAQPEPSRVVRLGPLPGRADRRTLVVANPSTREALVDVEVAGEAGSFTPEGLAQLRVPPGTVVTADVGKVVGQEPAALVLRSAVRLTATVRSVRDEDTSYAAVAPLLGGPAAAMLPAGLTASLRLTAGDDGGRARVAAYSAAGKELDATTLGVEPSATLAWEPKGRPAYLVVTPEKGRLFGGVALAGSQGLTQAPLRPLPTVLRRPVVVPVAR